MMRMMMIMKTILNSYSKGSVYITQTTVRALQWEQSLSNTRVQNTRVQFSLVRVMLTRLYEYLEYLDTVAAALLRSPYSVACSHFSGPGRAVGAMCQTEPRTKLQTCRLPSVAVSFVRLPLTRTHTFEDGKQLTDRSDLRTGDRMCTTYLY